MPYESPIASLDIRAPMTAERACEVLDDHSRHEIDHWLSKYPAERRRSAVMAALRAAQHQNQGYLTPELMDAVAVYMDLPPIFVYEAASFYSMFFTKPVGKNKIAICSNISCMLRGADKIIKYAENKLGIKLGETTADGQITLVMEEECVAACTGAPMMIINGHYHENLTEAKIDELLGGLS